MENKAKFTIAAFSVILALLLDWAGLRSIAFWAWGTLAAVGLDILITGAVKDGIIAARKELGE